MYFTNCTCIPSVWWDFGNLHGDTAMRVTAGVARRCAIAADEKLPRYRRRRSAASAKLSGPRGVCVRTQLCYSVAAVGYEWLLHARVTGARDRVLADNDFESVSL